MAVLVVVAHEREVAIVVAAVAVSVVDVPRRAPPAALRLEDGALYDHARVSERRSLSFFPRSQVV